MDLQDGRQLADDEDDADLDDALVREFHFGGGFVPKRPQPGGEAGEDAAAPERRRSKKEVWLDNVACWGSMPILASCAACAAGLGPCPAAGMQRKAGRREHPHGLSRGQETEILIRRPSQVMEEVIARSKAFKAAKAQQRDEDLSATEALDADFQV